MVTAGGRVPGLGVPGLRMPELRMPELRVAGLGAGPGAPLRLTRRGRIVVAGAAALLVTLAIGNALTGIEIMPGQQLWVPRV